MQGGKIKSLSVTSCLPPSSTQPFLPSPRSSVFPGMAERVFTTKLRKYRGDNISIRPWGKKGNESWLWIFIKMTHLFSNFSKVILLKVLSANFNYSLHWVEYRIHHVELIHSTRFFFLNSWEGRSGEEEEEAINKLNCHALWIKIWFINYKLAISCLRFSRNGWCLNVFW